jgi:hypothetical protein
MWIRWIRIRIRIRNTAARDFKQSKTTFLCRVFLYLFVARPGLGLVDVGHLEDGYGAAVLHDVLLHELVLRLAEPLVLRVGAVHLRRTLIRLHTHWIIIILILQYIY